MAESSTLTIRIDEDLKKQLETAAEAEDRTVTEFVVRSVKARMSRQCRSCGRSDGPSGIAAGFLPQFTEFLDARKTSTSKVTITTTDAGVRSAFNGRLDNLTTTHGTVILLLNVFDDAMREYPLPIPRGVVTGWEDDHDGRELQRLVVFGQYVDGNQRVRQQIEAYALAHRRRR